MNRAFLRSGVVAITLFAVAGMAQAVPALLDRTPAGNFVTIYIANPKKLDESVAAFSKLIGRPLPVGLKDMMSEMGPMAQHLRDDAPVAFSMAAPTPPKADAKGEMGDEPEPGENVVMLVPVKEYAAAIATLKGSDKGGYHAFTSKGETVFARDIGDGYAAVGPTEKTIKAFKGEKGQGALLKKMISPAADKVSETSDVVIVVNCESGREIMKMGWKGMQEQMEERMAMMPGANMAPMKFMGDMFVDQSRSIVMGMTFDSMGVKADMVPTFAEGSTLAKMCSTTGKSAALMSNMPKREYLFAGAIDTSNPELKKFADEMQTKFAGEMGGKGEGFMEAFSGGQGTSFLMGFSPAGAMGGLFNQTVVFSAGAGGEAQAGKMQAGMDKLDPKIGKGKYKAAAVDVDGTKVDQYEIAFKADPENAQAAQMMGMILGPSMTLSGYVGKTDKGLYYTMSKSSELMGDAMKAGKGTGGFSTDASVKSVMDKMPGNRIAEFYVGPRGIINTIIPVMQAFTGRAPKIAMPESVAPVGFALGSSEGSVQATIYLPNETLKTFMEFGKTMNGPGEDEEDAAPAAAPKKEKDKGEKPKF